MNPIKFVRVWLLNREYLKKIEPLSKASRYLKYWSNALPRLIQPGIWVMEAEENEVRKEELKNVIKTHQERVERLKTALEIIKQEIGQRRREFDSEKARILVERK